MLYAVQPMPACADFAGSSLIIIIIIAVTNYHLNETGLELLLTPDGRTDGDSETNIQAPDLHGNYHRRLFEVSVQIRSHL